jgi:hypothetical protein
VVISSRRRVILMAWRAQGKGVAEHGGRLLDHPEVDVKHSETSYFTALLEPLDLAGAVVTFDALCRRRHKASYAGQVVMPMPSSGAVLAAMAGRTTVGIITGTRGTPRERLGAGSVRPWHRAAPCGRALFP